MSGLEECCSSAGRRVADRELRDLLRGGGASPPSSDSLLEARLMRVSPRFSHDYCSPEITVDDDLTRLGLRWRGGGGQAGTQGHAQGHRVGVEHATGGKNLDLSFFPFFPLSPLVVSRENVVRSFPLATWMNQSSAAINRCRRPSSLI